ncbi:MAG: hypothetical protein GX564_03030 [Oligosphaeraceae bacterium]|nr:hypothetical protein [Oligosphaeraceae bacterium]
MDRDFFHKQPLRVLVRGRNLEDLLPWLRRFAVELVDEHPDLVITHGGDGSLLGAERDYPGVPKCPLRDRRQNPKCPRHSELSTLEKLFAGQLQRSSLEKLVAVTASGEELRGINDLVLSRELLSSAIRYRIVVDGELFRPQVVSDSLVIATPFGSTGYFQSITRGNFRTGIGLAFNNAMEGSGFSVLPVFTRLEVQILRGPAVLVADNDPQILRLKDGETLLVRLSDSKTTVYGLDVFRCPDCYQLRRDGI